MTILFSPQNTLVSRCLFNYPYDLISKTKPVSYLRIFFPLFLDLTLLFPYQIQITNNQYWIKRELLLMKFLWLI